MTTIPGESGVNDLTTEMEAAKRNSLGLWTGTKWLIAFLGASAPITFGIELTGDRELVAFRWLAVAGGAQRSAVCSLRSQRRSLGHRSLGPGTAPPIRPDVVSGA